MTANIYGVSLRDLRGQSAGFTGSVCDFYGVSLRKIASRFFKNSLLTTRKGEN